MNGRQWRNLVDNQSDTVSNKKQITFINSIDNISHYLFIHIYFQHVHFYQYIFATSTLEAFVPKW